MKTSTRTFFWVGMLLTLWPLSTGFSQNDSQVSPDDQVLSAAKTLFADSNLLWQRKLTGIRAPVATNNLVFPLEVVGDETPKCQLYCFDNTGEEKWKKSVWTPPKVHLSSLRLISDGTDQVGVLHKEGMQIRDFAGKRIKQEKNRIRPRIRGVPGSSSKDVSRQLKSAPIKQVQAFFYRPISTTDQQRDLTTSEIRDSRPVACIVQHAKLEERYVSRGQPGRWKAILRVASAYQNRSHIMGWERHEHFWQADELVENLASNREQIKSLSQLDFNCSYTSWGGPFPIISISLKQSDSDTIQIIPVEGGFFWNGVLSLIGNTNNVAAIHGLDSRTFFVANQDGQVVDNKLILISGDRLLLLVLKLEKIDVEVLKKLGPGAHAIDKEIKLNWVHSQDVSIASLLQHGQYIYLVNSDGTLVCLDTNTKQECYRQKLLFANKTVSTPVAHQGTVYIASQEGSIVSFKAGPKFMEKSVANFKDKIIGSPVFTDRQVYLQTAKNIYSFSLKSKNSLRSKN